ncbi:hypothetical protein CIG75_04080 [Tumebacillus algifaecis]|uniref:N-acetyltransferase domain-containing protein n=2 Tax=Tumebacillus algifaecis TaxID=1214604 RepID=A0A223D688_9BACL|nr:hypothetical protein CIG75_04080 [Tumebacillus algifaecis]
MTLKDGRTLTIRQAVAEDAAAILRYIKRVAGESENIPFTADEFTTTVEQEVEIIEDHALTDNKIFLIGLIDGEIASVLNFVGGQRQRVRHAGEFGLTVRESFWGLGVGTQMMTLLIDWAKSTGIIRRINLIVRADNRNAIQLYQKFGFAEEGVKRRNFLIDGVFYDSLYMGIDLD